jgi:hypothetical protein
LGVGHGQRVALVEYLHAGFWHAEQNHRSTGEQQAMVMSRQRRSGAVVEKAELKAVYSEEADSEADLLGDDRLQLNGRRIATELPAEL